MKKLTLIVCTACIVFFSSCSGDAKKVVVMASGTITVKDNVITLDPSNRHNEQTIPVSADKLIVKSPEGEVELPVPGKGLYVLNLKKDTLVGSYQRVGAGEGEKKITREELSRRVDSLSQLMAGTNTGGSGRNFNIPPNKVAKISENAEAEIIGPFRKLPGSYEAGKEHEIYKFYTNKEVVEIINRIKPLTADSTSQQ
jgi:hypothetical protein